MLITWRWKRNNLAKSLAESGGFFDIPAKQARLSDIEAQIEAIPDFWTNPTVSAPVLKEKKGIEGAIKRGARLQTCRQDLDAALELARESGEQDYLEEAERLVAELGSSLKLMETQSLLSEETDTNDALVTINAGAGGTESCDWAYMLYRMYLRFAERQGWKAEVHDILAGEEAGIKSVTFEAAGAFAFGLLKSESGVHRLVRISPFDSNARRHTSFASVYVTAVVDDDIEIEIKDSDLRIDTYRSQGAGGQHVNKTDSAIRITHLPTGVVVQCQSQRSQHQNRDHAMKQLRSKLYERELDARRAKQDAVESSKTDISFGHQIRSYVLHPYKLVKDHRTDYESHQPDGVLDGGLDTFINEYLMMKAGKKP